MIIAKTRREYSTAGMTKICPIDLYNIPWNGSVQSVIISFSGLKKYRLHHQGYTFLKFQFAAMNLQSIDFKGFFR